MPNLLQIVQHTPLWVFALLAALIWTGLQSLQDRTLPLWRLVLVPAIFIIWGSAVLASNADARVISWWGTAGLLSAIIGWATARTDGMRTEMKTGFILVPGSVLPIVRNLAIFTAKYVVTAAIMASAFDLTSLTEANAVISGVSAGFFIGWLLRFALWYSVARLLPRSTPVG